MSPQPSPQRIFVSLLDLPTELGCFNTPWRLFHERRPLLNLSSREKVASLAFDVTTREEFYDRASAFCDVIKSFIVPKYGAQYGGHSLEKLGPYLESILPTESPQQATEAIEVLAIFTLFALVANMAMCRIRQRTRIVQLVSRSL